MNEQSPSKRSLHIVDGRRAWPASVEAQGISHLRVRVDKAQGALPEWEPGTVVSCRFDSGTSLASIQGIVVHSDGGRAWIHLAGAWTADERRAGARSLGGFPVVLQWEGGKSTGTCVDISPGGMRLHLSHSEVLPASVAVGFRPPGEADQWILNGRIMHHEAVSESEDYMEVGLKFTELPTELGLRIEEYCRKG